MRTREDAKLAVSKTRDEKTDGTQGSGEDEALRQASASTTALEAAAQKKKQAGADAADRGRESSAYSPDPSTSSGSSSD